MQRGNPNVWTVHTSDRCIQTRNVHVKVPLDAIYKGPEARQPRAFMKGKGVITVGRNGDVTIE